MKLCEYGCGQEAKYQFKNGKWCCSENTNKCLGNKRKKSISLSKKIKSKEHCKKLSESMKGLIPWNKGLKGCYTKETIKKMSIKGKGKGRIPWNKGKTYTELYRKSI